MKAMLRYIPVGLLLLVGSTGLFAQMAALRADLANALNPVQRLDALLALAEAHQTDHPDSTYLYATEARSLATSQSSLPKETQAIMLLGEVEARRGNVPVAELHFQQVLKNYTALGDAEGQGRSCWGLAEMYGEALLVDSSDRYFALAVASYGETSADRTRLDLHRAYGEYLRQWERYGDAREQANTALDLAGALDERLAVAHCHLLLARIYRDWEKYSLSLAQYRQALVLYERTDDAAAEAATLKGLAQVQMALGKTVVAIDYAERGLAKARQSGAAAEAMDLYGILSQLMAETQAFERAFDYNQLQEMLRDSLLGTAARGDLASIVEKYEREKLRLENEKIAQQNELNATTIALQEQTIATQRTRFYAILGGLALMVLFGAVLIRSNIQRKRTNRKLATALADVQRTQTQLIRSEKLASLGQVTAGIAHEIRNPLNFVNNLSQLSVGMVDELEEELDTLKGRPFEGEDAEVVEEYFGDIRSNAAKINSHGKRATRIVQDMLAHAGNGEGQKHPVDLNGLVEEYLQMAFHGLKGRRPEFECGVEFSGAEGLGKVSVVSADLGRALLNMFSNAFEAVLQTGRKDGRVGVELESTAAAVVIRISDNGGGIPKEVVGQIFDPFFTTKPPNEGTGLGLSLAHETIVQVHGGSVQVRSTPGEGTEFRVSLPR